MGDLGLLQKPQQAPTPSKYTCKLYMYYILKYWPRGRLDWTSAPPGAKHQPAVDGAFIFQGLAVYKEAANIFIINIFTMYKLNFFLDKKMRCQVDVRPGLLQQLQRLRVALL